jgi:hypothetical protein
MGVNPHTAVHELVHWASSVLQAHGGTPLQSLSHPPPLLLSAAALWRTHAPPLYPHPRAVPGARVGICEMPYNTIASDAAGGAGGTCVLRGCVPKKLFVYAAEYSQEFRDAQGFG